MPQEPRLVVFAASIVSALALCLCASSAARAGSDWSSFLISPNPGGTRPGEVNAVSCPREDLCVATGTAGRAITSTNPPGGPTAWSIANVDGDQALYHVSCTPSGLCVATDESGDVLTSTDPTRGAGTWQTAHIDTLAEAAPAVSCPSSALCAIVDGTGGVLTSTDPTAGAESWTRTPVTTADNPLVSISCATASFCVAGSANSALAISTDPTGGPGAWQTIHPHHAGRISEAFASVSCPTTRFCAAVGAEAGDVLTSTDPTGGPRAWKDTKLRGEQRGNDGPLVAISCPSSRMCVAIDHFGDQGLTTIDPTGGPRAWVKAFSGLTLLSLSCASERLCVAGDVGGNAYVSTDPGAAARQAARPRVKGAVRGLTRRHARLTLQLRAGIPPARRITSLTLTAPRGIRFAGRRTLRRHIRINRAAGKHHRRFAVRHARRHRLRIAFGSAVRRVRIKLTSRALHASRHLTRRARRGRLGRLTLHATVRDTHHTRTKVSARLRVR